MSEVASELECPICFEYMHPPIRMCNSGHSFCDICSTKVNQCPLCKRQLIPNVRNYTLEKIHSRLEFPCRHDGCTKVISGRGIVEHIKACSFKSKKCPLAIYNCEWRGSLSQIADHCHAKHAHNYIESNGSLNVIVNTRVDTFQRTLVMLVAFKHHFLLAIELDKAKNTIRFCTAVISENKKSDFEYEIQFEKSIYLNQKTQLRSFCPVYANGEHDFIFKLENFITYTYDKLDDYSINNRLPLQVKLYTTGTNTNTSSNSNNNYNSNVGTA